MNSFNYKKAVQALLFFSLHEKNKSINKVKAIKLLFFAERFHVRKFGRMITNDSFWAMKMGPVPSGAKNLIDKSEYMHENGKDYFSFYLSKTDSNFITARQPFNDEVFSESDIEALQFAWDKFGHLSYSEIVSVSHKYPEWFKYSSKIEKGKQGREKIHLTDFLDNPAENIEMCYDLTEEDKEAARELINESMEVEKLWK